MSGEDPTERATDPSAAPASDAQRLAGYVEVWWQSIDDFTRLLESIPAQDWSTETDLPGWDIQAVAAHTAHLESILAGAPEETVEVGSPDHARGLMGLYTEQGVVARRDRSPDDLIREIRSAATARHTRLLEDPPTDGRAKPDRIFGGIGWTIETLLRNRPLDVWMHEQDVRRAVGRPGGMESRGARHTADYLIESLGVVVGKRVAPPVGTTVLLDVAGSPAHAVRVEADGRARVVPADGVVPGPSTAILRMSREDFIVVAGGRRAPSAVTVEGDRELATTVLDTLAVTP